MGKRWKEKVEDLATGRVGDRKKGRRGWWLALLLPLLLLGAAFWWLVRQPKDHTAWEDELDENQRDGDNRVEDNRVEDNLVEIEGIGPKTAGVLREAGIVTFAQLADAEVEKLREILRDGELRGGDPSTWPEQARFAAQGDWEGLYALREKLHGGRRVD